MSYRRLDRDQNPNAQDRLDGPDDFDMANLPGRIQTPDEYGYDDGSQYSNNNSQSNYGIAHTRYGTPGAPPSRVNMPPAGSYVEEDPYGSNSRLHPPLNTYGSSQFSHHSNHSYHPNQEYDDEEPPAPPQHQYVNMGSIAPSDGQYDSEKLYPPGYQPNASTVSGFYPSSHGGWSEHYSTDNGWGDEMPMLNYPDMPDPDDDDSSQQHVRPAGVAEITLYKGNLVLDCPTPPALLSKVNHIKAPQRDEFTHMRYSAATCEPADFVQSNFTLRQTIFSKPRQTEIFIVITMYNENELLFARTMIGVINNIRHMTNLKNSSTWGPGSWKKIVVCVVSDGRAKINPRTRALLAAMGVYQEGIAKQEVNDKPVTAHIYEYTTQMGLKIKNGVVSVTEDRFPIQMLFCLKEENKKKINSHRWFFDGFGPELRPNICVLLDAGTKPGDDSIYQLWKAFDLEPMCGGACGEIKALLNKGKNLRNPLVATQNFEYKMSNILDKPFESAFGFISVLPGAFSAYRYAALQNDATGKGPLEKYFLGEKMHGGGDAGVFEANMYLAEDRILCFELVSKRQCHWILQYVKSATGETDVPTEMGEFVSQRRRWLNGSFFAAIYAVANCLQIFRSSHSFMRKMMFMFEFLYQTINMLFAWFALGNFFLVFRILTNALGSEVLLGTTGKVLAIVSQWLYIGTLITCFILSLGNKPSGSRKFYVGCTVFWALIMAYLIFASIFITVRSIQQDLADGKFEVSELVKNPLFFTLIVSMLSTYVLYLVASLLFFDPWHMFTSFIQYLLMTPTYINILNVYAFCNTHDVTWGTKSDGKADALPSVHTKDDGSKADFDFGSVDVDVQYRQEMQVFAQKQRDGPKTVDPEEKKENFYKDFRSGVVLAWMFTNLALTALVLQTGGLDMTVKPEDKEKKESETARIYMAVVLWSVAGLSAVRFVGCVWFLVVRMFRGV